MKSLLTGSDAPPAQGTVIESFLAAAHAKPRSNAVASDQSISYQELEVRTRNLAWTLRELGIREEHRVGVAVRTGAAIPLALFGVLRAAAAYVPLDISSPPEVLKSIINDASVSALVVDEPVVPPLLESGLPLVDIGQRVPRNPTERANDLPDPSAASLAYIVYTSGSTGRPKGVMIEHGALAASTDARLKVYGAPPDRFLLLSPYTFDSAVAGIFSTLCYGGTLVILSDAERVDARAARAAVSREGITTLLTIPSFYQLILAAGEGALDTLTTVIVAGEECPASLVNQHFTRTSHCKLWNEYGPSEATVWATVHECLPSDGASARGRVPIGHPIPRVCLGVVGDDEQLVTRGDHGELWIAGPTLARGYLGRDSETAASFVPEARSPLGDRSYRSGDLVRMNPNGALEFLGRIDRQVKIRGHRIEIEGIEAALRSHPAIKEAAVLAQETPAGLRLFAFVSLR
jgi:amino acid adenylation domain-containing protein